MENTSVLKKKTQTGTETLRESSKRTQLAGAKRTQRYRLTHTYIHTHTKANEAQAYALHHAAFRICCFYVAFTRQHPLSRNSRLAVSRRTSGGGGVCLYACSRFPPHARESECKKKELKKEKHS